MPMFLLTFWLVFHNFSDLLSNQALFWLSWCPLNSHCCKIAGSKVLSPGPGWLELFTKIHQTCQWWLILWSKLLTSCPILLDLFLWVLMVLLNNDFVLFLMLFAVQLLLIDLAPNYSRCPGDRNLQLGMLVLLMFPARFSVGTGVDKVALIFLHNFFLP